MVVAHDFDRALVLAQRVIEGDLLVTEPFLLPAVVGRTNVLRASAISSWITSAVVIALVWYRLIASSSRSENPRVCTTLT